MAVGKSREFTHWVDITDSYRRSSTWLLTFVINAEEQNAVVFLFGICVSLMPHLLQPGHYHALTDVNKSLANRQEAPYWLLLQTLYESTLISQGLSDYDWENHFSWVGTCNDLSLLSMSHGQSVVSGLVLLYNEGHSVVLTPYFLRLFFNIDWSTWKFFWQCSLIQTLGSFLARSFTYMSSHSSPEEGGCVIKTSHTDVFLKTFSTSVMFASLNKNFS